MSRRVSRARDQRADAQFDQTVEDLETVPEHADNHKQTGSDPVQPSEIGAETPAGAQAKADTAESNAKGYTDTHEGKDNPHSGSASNTALNSHETASNPHNGSAPRQGGTTANRPSSPANYEPYFDTDLNKPIWYNGTDWVDATGTIV